MEKKNLIKDWAVEMVGKDSFVICGRIFNDERCRFQDGSYVHTSQLRLVDFENKVAVTRNSTYNLE